MAFNPTSTIYLCNVPFDSSYKHQVYFADTTSQFNYFYSKKLKTFTEYLTVRKNQPNGGIQSSVKVGANIDDVQTCNYMMYQNANHGNKWFYAFIEKLVYINENTTEVIFETDVYQTWLFDVTLRKSYVVREHSETDEMGDNIVPEKFNFQEFNYSSITPTLDNTTGDFDEWGYLIGTSVLEDGTTAFGQSHSGVYQGLAFYYFTTISKINAFIDTLTSEGQEGIVFIALVPTFIIGSANLTGSPANPSATEGLLSSTTVPSSTMATIQFSKSSVPYGFTHKNNKLYTSPFCNVVVSNHNGQEAVYNLEERTGTDGNGTSIYGNLRFMIKGDISASPSLTLYPLYYKGISENIDCGISIKDFPQCSFNADSFKLWLARNTGTLALDTLGNVGQIVAGIATTAATSGAGAAIGVSQIVSGVQGILGTVNSTYQASKEPNKSNAGAPRNNLLTAIGKNKFDFYYRTIKDDYARTVDDFFTMYGYQTNRVKVPNISSRPHFNYVQTIDVNITGGIPCEDMLKLKSMYNSGVTLWKHTSTMYDYSVDNSPT